MSNLIVSDTLQYLEPFYCGQKMSLGSFEKVIINCVYKSYVFDIRL